MKTTFTLIALFLFSGLQAKESWHHAPASQLQLRFTHHADYSVQIAGQQYFVDRSVLNLHQIRPGRHFMRVSRNIYGRAGRIVGRHLIYRGPINVPANSRVFARITPAGNLFIDQVNPIRPVRPNGPNRNWVPPQNRNRQGNFHAPGMNHGASNFGLFLNSIRSESFDRAKLDLSREYLRFNALTSDQVVRVMNQITFDSGKIEFAKMAYPNVLDPQNFFITMNALTFNSSKRELQRYISGF